MFVHQHQLDYQLERRHYTDSAFFQTEIEKLFLPGWHLVGSKADLPNEGDFFTLELFGEPLIVRRENGFHCFLNVCSHRHCTLTSAPSGNQPALACQYHGWEYKTDGYTAKIPDARCFRPFDRNRARLHKFRLESCGEFLYVCLQDNGISLQKYLGDWFGIIDGLFRSGEHRQNWAWENDFECNWKIPIENTVESYHLPCVHKGFFAGMYPSEQAQNHELNDRYSTLSYDLREDRKTVKATRRTINGIGGKEPNFMYFHHLTHPNLVFAVTDLVIHAQVYLPISPTRSRTMIRMYAYQGNNRGPRAWFFRKLTNYLSRKIDFNVQTEDATVFDQTQQGVEASRYPGCIGTREERIYTFHKFLLDRCEPDPSRQREQNEPAQTSQSPASTQSESQRSHDTVVMETSDHDTINGDDIRSSARPASRTNH